MRNLGHQKVRPREWDIQKCAISRKGMHISDELNHMFSPFGGGAEAVIRGIWRGWEWGEMREEMGRNGWEMIESDKKW